MTTFSEATGRQVVSTTTAETVGRIDEFVIDPGRQAVVALRLKKTAGADALLWSGITAFGVDAVTVDGVERLTAAGPEVEALGGKEHRVLGKRVLATTGDELGTVDDVEFDAETGVIAALLLASGAVTGDRLLGIGSYAVVVRAR